MKKNIMITCAGRRVELVQSFFDALKKLKIDSLVLCTDSKPEFSAACQIADKAFKTNKIDHQDYVSELLNICKKNNVKVVIPTIDTELSKLTRNRELFLKHGIEIIISEKKLIDICNDKRKSSKFFVELGFNVPKIFGKQNIEYPCFSKPYDGSNSNNAKKIVSENEISEEMQEDQKLIYMEYITKEFCEYTIDGYYDKESLLKCLVPRKRIEVRGGEVSKGVTVKNFAYEKIFQRVRKLEGARGCLTFQFFVNENNQEILGLEINPRFGGGYPLTVAAGANFSEWITREYLLDQEVSFTDSWKENILMLRYDAKIITEAPS
jgi:carbamoyl-phosphate synthase large subunit